MRAPTYFIAVVLLSSSALGADAQQLTVTVPRANVRQGPGLNHPILETLDEGARVEQLGKAGNWWKVGLDPEREGFIRSDLVRSAADTPSETDEITQAPSDAEPLTMEEAVSGIAPPSGDPEEAVILSEPVTSSPIPEEEETAPLEKAEDVIAEGEVPPEEVEAPTGPELSTTTPPTPAKEAEKKPKITVFGDLYYAKEFRELALAIQPGFVKGSNLPATADSTGFSISAPVSWYVYQYLALHVPYTYTRYSSNVDLHSLGGGPQVRYLDWGPLRGEIDASILYVRAFGSNHLGWSGGGDLAVGSRKAFWKPFVGPFFRFEQVFTSGQDVVSYSFGLGLTLTNLTDLD